MKHISPMKLVFGLALAVAANAMPIYSGTPAGWTVGGDGATVTISTLGSPTSTSLTPTTNSTFVLISNGPGTSATFGTFSNSFSIGAGGGSISFSYWFVTEEFTGTDAGSPGLDNYTIAISGPASQTITGNVAESGFACFDGGDCAVAATVPLSSSFLQFVSYKKYTPAAIPLTAGNYSITFSVFDDAGDAAFDSGLLIDTVVVRDNTTSGVPEPATMWLAAGGLGLLLWRKRS